MTAINGMFTETNGTTETTNSRSLSGTAQLTNLAMELGNKVMQFINDGLSNEDTTIVDYHANLLNKSKTDHGAMDELIDESHVLDFAAGKIEFLKELDEATIEGMLKSQQSKRSRAKGKQMTKDNYMSMLTGAIAENLIRLATGKEKQAARRMAGEVNYTEETLQKLAGDQDALRKELRNIQSKKSIMKSKEGFSEESDGWKNLLAAEAALKGIRVAGAGGTKTIEIDTTREKLAVFFNGFNPEELDISDKKIYTRQKLAEIIEGWQAMFMNIKKLTVVAETEPEDEAPATNDEEQKDPEANDGGNAED